MPAPFEVRRENFTISTDSARLDLQAIAGFLGRSYWAKERPLQTIERSLANSLVFGVYDGERQIGLARIVSDYATFAWLCDVFLDEDYRGRGLGKWLMQTVLSHPDLQGLRRLVLITRDAHGLYRQSGWDSLHNPEGWMEILNPPR